MAITCFAGITLASFALGFGIFIDDPILISIITFAVMVIGIYALRGLYFALIEEAKTSIVITGTVIGIISLIGYTPDIFMSLISGIILGENPTLIDYQKLFKVVTLFPMVGVLATIGFQYFVKREKG